MGLNFTSANPSARDTPGSTQNGYLPSPVCARTLGADGALSSFVTAHFGVPSPVTPADQPCGKAPGATSSKFTVVAAADIATPIESAAARTPSLHALSWMIRVIRC